MTEATTYMTISQAVLHDRTERRKMSRRVWGESAGGLTENRVHALEHDKKIKPGELEKIAPLIGDLIDPALTAATLDPEITPTSLPPKPEKPEPEPDPNAVYEAERAELGQRYVVVMTQLGNRIPPYSWPSQFRLETAPPIEFQAISEWINHVTAWLVEQDGSVGTDPGAGDGPEGAEGERLPPAEVPPADPSSTEWGDENVDEEDWYDPGPSEPYTGQDYATPGAETLSMPDQPPPGPQVYEDAEQFVLDPSVPWYVTNGELTTYADCERRWMLQNYRRIGRPTEKMTGPAMIGTRFHEALAAWYQPTPGDPWLVFNERTKERQQALEDDQASEDVFKEFNSDTDMVRAMLEGYFQWVQESSADAGLQIIGSEMVVSVDPHVPGFEGARLLTKLDVRVLQELDGSKAFLDHKTVGSFADALKQLVGNEQMLTYHLVEYLQLVEAGLDKEQRSAGALYNMARKVKRTAQANPPFYMREPVKHNLDQLQAHWLRVKGRMQKIAATRAALDAGVPHWEAAPARWNDTCSWKCEFFALCPMMDHSAAGAEAMLQEQFVQINPLARYEPAAVGSTL